MIAVSGLRIRQGNFTLKDVTFTIPDGAYGVLMGPTGCGKTTLLECLAGLRTPTGGRLTLAGRDVTTLPPACRNVGYVPQEAAVFTHLTVWENLAFGLAVRKTPKVVTGSRVAELASGLGLTHLLNRRAIGLSGGEAQRVALGRALAFRPAVLLLDEPLNAVDETTAERLLSFLRHERAQPQPTTVLHVTHDWAEANALADVHLCLDGGRVIPLRPEWSASRDG